MFDKNVAAEESAPTQSHKENDLVYNGLTGTVYKIWLVNLLLRLITLNIYSFWAKVKIRKYVASSFTLGNDPFEYTGTGGELFRGFLKAVGIWLGISLIYGITSVVLGEESLLQIPLLIAFYVLIVYLIGAAIYGAFGYRIAHTHWRGIRGQLTGNIWDFAKFILKRSIINLVTLGLKVPESDLMTHERMMNNAYFGNVKANYAGNVKNIYKPFIIAMLPVYAAILLLGVIMATSFASGTPEEAIEGLAPFFILFVPLVIISLIAQLWYRAALTREKFAGLTIGDIHFKSTVTAGAIFRLAFVNGILLMFTLGLASPIVMQRKMRFIEQHIKVLGDLETAEIMQAPKQEAGIAEGLDDVLGLDTGLM